MVKVNDYFDGRVKSIAFQAADAAYLCLYR